MRIKLPLSKGGFCLIPFYRLPRADTISDFFLFLMANPFRKVRLFYVETSTELKKSVWPTWKELRKLSLIVIVAVLIAGAFISLADFALTNVVTLFTDLVH